MWHVSSRSGVATLRTAIHLLLTYLFTTAALSWHGLSVVSTEWNRKTRDKGKGVGLTGKPRTGHVIRRMHNSQKRNVNGIQ